MRTTKKENYTEMSKYEGENVDELIYKRGLSRDKKQWGISDDIRDYLDSQLVFVFDATWGQEVYYLTDKYFTHKNKQIQTIGMSYRQYLEFKIQEGIRAEKIFNSWLFVTRNKNG